MLLRELRVLRALRGYGSDGLALSRSATIPGEEAHMLQVQNLRKSYGAATVLADISFIVNDGERVGLIGPNGAGKTTILRCLVGQEQPDAGTITLSPPGMAIGYLPQA